MQVTEQTREYAQIIQKESFDLARTSGVPEVLKGTTAEVLAEDFVDLCMNSQSLTPEQKKDLLQWQFEAHAARTIPTAFLSDISGTAVPNHGRQQPMNPGGGIA